MSRTRVNGCLFSSSPGSGGSYVHVPVHTRSGICLFRHPVVVVRVFMFQLSSYVHVKEAVVAPLWWECSEMCSHSLFLV